MIKLLFAILLIPNIAGTLFYYSMPGDIENTRVFEIEGEQIRVTYDVDEMFFGLYEGRKSGYLSLNKDGTGEYKYDIFGISRSDCKEDVILFEWGVPVDRNNEKVKFKKPYGYSYPVIFKCIGETCFQGCSKQYIIEFILDKNDGKLHVSSSDDWQKSK